MRRELKLDNLDDTVAECRRLLETGYLRNGNWSLAQICNHIRLTIEANMQGYPMWMTALGLPMRPLLRHFALPRLLAGNSIQGVRTASMFVPSANLDDAAELVELENCVREFQQSTRPLHAHPGFGRMSREEFNQFHAAHAAHHLSFLSPRVTLDSIDRCAASALSDGEAQK